MSEALPSSRGTPASIFDAEHAPAYAVIAAVLIFAIAQIGHMADVFTALKLPDSDDAMRLVGVRDLLSGQAWFDTTQHRYLPPAGASMHWSRLIDGGLAGLILILRPIVGATAAEALTVSLWPLFLLAAFLTVLAVGGTRFFGSKVAALAVLATLIFPSLTFEFSVGRIDHHDIQLILSLVVVFGTMAPLQSLGWPLAGGVAAGLSLGVGLEMLPAIALAGIIHVFVWIAKGSRAGPALVAFSGGLAAASVLTFLAQTSPGEWGVPACDALSPPWLMVSVGALMVVLILRGLDRLPLLGRLAAAAGGGAVLLAALLLVYPACLAGPYSMLPEMVKRQWLDQVGEAMPLWRALRLQPDVIAEMGPRFVAALLAIVYGLLAAPPIRGRLLVLAAFLWLGLLISLFEIRGVAVGGAMLPLVAGYVLAALLDRAHAPPPRRWLWPRAIAAVLLIAPLWLVVPWTVRQLRGEAAPEGYATVTGCRAPDGVAALEALPVGTVLAPIDLGPDILLRTHHAIIAAPYHRNVAGLVAAITAFGGSEADVKAVMSAMHADYLVICPALVPAQGQANSFAAKLAAGAKVPWLVPEPVSAGPLKVWRVVPGGGTAAGGSVTTGALFGPAADAYLSVRISAQSGAG